ncbi:MAG: pseudouridine-5-phosphate glycosidase [Anaerolineae bacterium]|nr:MAG: pseudouridine-5-phosphate glycosidase [Anaerolineae bacterium]WKZ45073.1 MAG: pseudouridine-5'-phosphate glycosidase [Anaerolineales bacterium]
MEELYKSPDVGRAMRAKLPVVALESTVITHGLPRPQNLELARDMERAVREESATPATIAFLDGELHIGLNESQLERLSNEKETYKVGPRDFATVIVEEACGGTTVAGTMLACKHAGIKVFATGGIGGVHRESSFDVSADLQALATIPMIVVCAGAKAILDLPATLEYLETMGVPVVGYKTDDFPAFYSRESGLEVSVKIESPEDIVEFAREHWGAGLQSAVLVANPLPAGEAIPKSEMEPLIEQASKEAKEKGIHGKEVTPFLLQRINELTKGKSMRANLALLLNNARLAAQIARAWRVSEKRKIA